MNASQKLFMSATETAIALVDEKLDINRVTRRVDAFNTAGFDKRDFPAWENVCRRIETDLGQLAPRKTVSELEDEKTAAK